MGSVAGMTVCDLPPVVPARLHDVHLFHPGCALVGEPEVACPGVEGQTCWTAEAPGEDLAAESEIISLEGVVLGHGVTA